MSYVLSVFCLSGTGYIYVVYYESVARVLSSIYNIFIWCMLRNLRISRISKHFCFYKTSAENSFFQIKYFSFSYYFIHSQAKDSHFVLFSYITNCFFFILIQRCSLLTIVSKLKREWYVSGFLFIEDVVC